jgi:glycosyltransferase involved in cell wall biosynthesis
MGSGQDVSMLVRAARRLADTRDVTMILVGDGSQREALQLSAADLPGLRFLDPVTARSYPVLLAAADVLVLNERLGNPDRTLPGKLHSYLQAGRPIIAAVNRGGDAERAAQEVARAVAMIAPGDSQALAATIAGLRDDAPRRDRMAAAAARYAAPTQPGTTPAPQLRDVVRLALATNQTQG